MVKMIDVSEIFMFYSYGIPMFIINLRTMYVLWTGRKTSFSSSYYGLFFYCVCNECLLYLANNYCVRWPSIPFMYEAYFYNLTEFSRWNSPMSFIRRACSYFINFSNLLLSFNRLTVVWKYATHERLWSEYRFLWMTFMFGGTFIVSGQELLNSSKFTELTVGNMTVIQLTSDDAFNPMVASQITVPIISTSIILGVGANIVAFFVWRNRRVEIPTRRRTYEMKLIWLTVTFYGLGVFVVG